MTVGDFDNDGDMDVAACVDYRETPDPDKDLIYIALNDGTGILSLSSESPYTLSQGSSYGPGDVVAGNFDLIPGILQLPDLFTSGAEINGLATVVSGSNIGGAVFSLANVGACPAYLTDIKPGVLTSGHLQDDAIGVGSDRNVYVYHSDGNGGFSIDCTGGVDDVYPLYETGIVTFYPLGLDVGHLNGGTKLDVVAADAYGSEVVCLLGKGDGTLQHSLYDNRYYHDVGAARPIRVAVADMDQDGFSDIITSNHGEVNDPASISVLINEFTISSQ
ncbi:MAG: hypothetical protein ACF8R9_15830 [Phycisphaerales bacterium JB054]